MKIKLLPIFLLLLSYSNAQQAKSLEVIDSRSINNSPSAYNREVKAEFKQRELIGAPGNGYYSTFLTLAPWGDSSGGKINQLNFNEGGVFFRQGIQGSAWEAWSKILMENSAGKIGIGGDVGYDRLTITGGHSDSNILLHANNGINAHAYLTLWASEPASTYTGTGIGNNVRGDYNNVPFRRIETNRGGSYMRLLDNEMSFNLVDAAGNTKIPLVLAGNGQANFQYPVAAPSIISSASDSGGGNLTLVNGSKIGDAAHTWRLYNMTGAYGNSLQFWSYSQNSYGVKLKLADNGDIAAYGKLEAKEVKVTTTPTADFVFEEDYKLPSLESVEKHIKTKKHLPEIASAKEMEKEGVNIGEFQIKLLQKIEELTLYTIEQNKQLKLQSEKIKALESKLDSKN